MNPILAFTANLVAETTYYADQWSIEATGRAHSERFQVGGKGVNVCKMLQRLGGESQALCFPGGPFGTLCEDWLKGRDFPYVGFGTGCITRSGSVIRVPGQKETTILGIDSQVSLEAVADCVSYLDGQPKPFYLAFCGVFQDWDSPNWQPLRDWIGQRDPSIRIAIDTYGPALPWFARQRPDIIKINRQELETLFDASERHRSTEELLRNASALYACPLWIVTDGDAAIHYIEQDRTPRTVLPRTARCLSATGCGDVFFATLLHARVCLPELTIETAIKRAAEFATRNAESLEIAEFSLD